ncbi:hypothetical protein [Polymorphum gilvum]|nr:hypothetical protein [Polymorphum gilvum]
MNDEPGAERLTPWSDLDEARQTELLAAYQADLDALPPTCSLETKVERFARWLAGRGIGFSMDDVGRPGPGHGRSAR